MDPFNGEAASQLNELLGTQDQRIVFAESCTAGLIAASLGRIPGVSARMAGSAVVYQLETKARWLQVSAEALEDPGPVSQIVSEQMAQGVLETTPHATMAASVTGHLGPDAPKDQDGIAWSSVAVRASDTIVMTSRQLKLDDSPTDVAVDSTNRRQQRQINAARLVLQFCIEQLQR